MLHREEWLAYWDQGLGDALLQAKADNLIHYIGVSLYTPESALQALSISDIDLIQGPGNAWDTRLDTTNVIQKSKQANTLLMIRSILLQGLLSMNEDSLTHTLPEALPALKQWKQLAKEYQVSQIRFLK